MELALMIEGQEGVTWPQWLALARACEQHGIPALFRSDHYLSLAGDRPAKGALDAWTTLAALAAVTTTLRLGTLVTPPTFRHPSVLAKVVTTVDHVSAGRTELGLGAGWHEPEHTAYGFPFPPARTRLAILEEQIRVLLAHWTDGLTTLNGNHYLLRDLDAQPKPVQYPRPRLILGGSAGPRSAALAARYADEYNTGDCTPEDLPRRMTNVAEACERAGRDPIPISVQATIILGADARNRARHIRDASVLATPPASRIVGTVDQAADQVAQLRDAGVSRIFCQHLDHQDVDALELLGHLARLIA